MNTPGNARSTASKTAIQDAMIALLAEKEPGQISVQDIVKRAGVNRSTFYAHYLDTGDLMKKIEADMVAPLAAGMYAENATANTIFSETALAGLVAFSVRTDIFTASFLQLPPKAK